MSIRPIQPVSPEPSTAALPPTGERRFSDALRALGRRLDPHDPAVIRQTAAQLVSETVFVPLLAEMREFPFGRELGHGGRGEAAFAAQLDQRVADAVAASERGGLVDQLTQRLTASAAWRTRPQAGSIAEGDRHDA